MSDFPESLREARALDAQQHYADQARIAVLEQRLRRARGALLFIASRDESVTDYQNAYTVLIVHAQIAWEETKA